MTAAGNVEGRERLRLFIAFRLPEAALRGLVRWQREALDVPDDVRVVPKVNLHATIAFLGSRPAEELDSIAAVVREAAADGERPLLTPKRYRETRSVGMVVYDDEAGRAAEVAEAVQSGLEKLGVYKTEKRPWLPHVTVARFRRAPRLTPPMSGLAAVSPSEAAVYHSVLRPGGAQYEVLESVALGG
jgi:RNA 2',3'-cyclic 3'-phosphodiesterase